LPFRITKDFAGTPEDPVVVESAFEERIVGVPDPEDDCLVIWDLIKANEPPKQIIEGGEYFVLKTVEPAKWTGIPEGAQTQASCS
jgi:cytochrome c oxidase subunit 5b